VIVVLPHDTIVRILDHETTTPSAASGVGSRRAARPLPSEAAPALSEDIIHALNKAKTDKAKLVGPLEPNEFNALSAWCRSIGLTKEAETVEAAVRASG
jgi:hypothetical protein